MEPGDRFGEYVLGARLGSGGQGDVFEATDALGLTWAIKIGPLLDTNNQMALERFAKEAAWVQNRLRQLPRDCGILVGEHYGVHERRYYVKMRLLRGLSLADLLRKRGAVPLVESLEIALAVAKAVALAHSQEALHRDLKPENIFLEDGLRVQVLDWGCIQLIEAGRMATTGASPICTVGYASLEQLDLTGPRPTTATDVYSLGVVLIEMLTGKNPFLLHRRHAEWPTDTLATSSLEQTKVAGPIPTLVHLSGAPGNSQVTTRTAPTALLDHLPAERGHETRTTPRTAAADRPAAHGFRASTTLRDVVHRQLAFHAEEALAIVENIPRPLAALLGRMVTPKPDTRIASMGEVVRCLETLLVSANTHRGGGDHDTTSPGRRTLQPLHFGIAVSLALGLVCATWWRMTKSSATEDVRLSETLSPLPALPLMSATESQPVAAPAGPAPASTPTAPEQAGGASRPLAPEAHRTASNAASTALALPTTPRRKAPPEPPEAPPPKPPRRSYFGPQQ